MAAIQNLKHTLDVDDATIRILDGLRKQRNLAGYDGDLVTDSALAECIKQATALLAKAEERLHADGWLVER